MITDLLLYLLYGVILVLTAPFRLLSNVSLSSDLTATITTAGSYLKAVNSILPIDTLLAIFGIILGYEVVILTYKIIMWIIKKIPGIN